MTVHNSTDALAAEMLSIGAAAREAARAMREADDETKSHALLVAAGAIRARVGQILAANAEDIAAARAANMPANMVDRLMLNEARIEAMAKGIEVVAALPDPVGRQLARWDRPNGLDIARVATPIGVIGIIYESRPNVTADAGALTLKSGNVAILRGGSDSIRSSAAIHFAMVEGLKAAGLPQAALQVVKTPDRAAVGMMLEGLNGTVDLIIPRGGKGLTGRVINEAKVPVLAHLGLTPQSVHAFGGYRVQGRGEDGARLLQDAKALESAGAIAGVLEDVPADLAARVTEVLTIPTIGIGAGAATDAQVIGWQDMAGLTSGKTAKFVKKYADMHGVLLGAAKAWSDDVVSGAYPAPEHTYE